MPRKVSSVFLNKDHSLNLYGTSYSLKETQYQQIYNPTAVSVLVKQWLLGTLNMTVLLFKCNGILDSADHYHWSNVKIKGFQTQTDTLQITNQDWCTQRGYKWLQCLAVPPAAPLAKCVSIKMLCLMYSVYLSECVCVCVLSTKI